MTEIPYTGEAPYSGTVSYSGSVSVNPNDLRTVLRLVGFPEASIDTAQAIAQAESAGYEDAVGDLSLVSAKWGPSIGLFQIRSLRSPQSYTGTDRLRWSLPLQNRWYNAGTALQISKGGTDWSAWSTFTSNAYQTFLGAFPTIKTGHDRAAEWWR